MHRKLGPSQGSGGQTDLCECGARVTLELSQPSRVNSPVLWAALLCVLVLPTTRRDQASHREAVWLISCQDQKHGDFIARVKEHTLMLATVLVSSNSPPRHSSRVPVPCACSPKQDPPAETTSSLPNTLAGTHFGACVVMARSTQTAHPTGGRSLSRPGGVVKLGSPVHKRKLSRV